MKFAALQNVSFKKKFFIFIFLFLSVFSDLSLAEAERGLCENCYTKQQVSNNWLNIQVSESVQTSQLQAGYPMGCLITSMLYALKFGPQRYRRAYNKIVGSSDIEKIQSLALIFGAQKSRDKINEAAFSEQYGSNPNDLPWMFQSLVPGSPLLKLTTYLVPEVYSKKNDMISDLRKKVITSLTAGMPLLIQLLYQNPSFSHAVLVIGIEGSASINKNLKIRILDPMTGRQSFASVEPGIGTLGDTKFEMLKFSNPNVTSRDGFLLSILN